MTFYGKKLENGNFMIEIKEEKGGKEHISKLENIYVENYQELVKLLIENKVQESKRRL